MHNNVPAKERAKGQWYQILRSLGVEDSFLNKRNGPCPLCGGDDRYRWKDTNDRGEYYCNQCGPGDGFQLLMKLHSWTFPETACQIEEFLGTGTTVKHTPKPKNVPSIAINKVISESRAITPGDEVCQYLEDRGLCGIPQDLLFHPALYESETKKTFPAMIALVRDLNGVVVCAHRTFLQAGEKAKISSPRKMMSPVRTVNGATIRLFSTDSHIGLAEGIETAIAAHQIFNIPVWAAISANGVKTFEPPEGINEVTVFGDNDRNFNGQRAAYDLANRLSLKGITAYVRIPDKTGQDWADVLLQKQEVMHG
jgi:putative DNA primase/helicase